MDLESRLRWAEYSHAKDEMFAHTDIPDSPWYVVASDVKKHARINCIRHMLSLVPYEDADRPAPKVGPRPKAAESPRPPIDRQNFVPEAHREQLRVRKRGRKSGAFAISVELRFKETGIWKRPPPSGGGGGRVGE